MVSFLKNDPDLDASDPRVIGYKGKNYLTTMSYLRLVSSTDGIHFKDEPEFPPNRRSVPKSYRLRQSAAVRSRSANYIRV